MHGTAASDETRPTEPPQRLDDLARQVIDAALEVHRTLGPGFLESIYHDALAVELMQRGLPCEREVPLIVRYKGFAVGEGRVDFVVARELLVELTSVEHLAPIHVAQVISHLKAFNQPLGLLITFNVQLLRNGVRRVMFTQRSR